MNQNTFNKLSGMDDTTSILRVEKMTIRRPQKGRLTELFGYYGIYFELAGADYTTGLGLALDEEGSVFDKSLTERFCMLTGVDSIAQMDGKVIEVMMRNHATIVAIRQDTGADEVLVSEAVPGSDWLFVNDFLAEFRA